MLSKISKGLYLLKDGMSVLNMKPLEDSDKIQPLIDKKLYDLLIARATALYVDKELELEINEFIIVNVELDENVTLKVSVGAVNVNKKIELLYDPYYD